MVAQKINLLGVSIVTGLNAKLINSFNEKH